MKKSIISLLVLSTLLSSLAFLFSHANTVAVGHFGAALTHADAASDAKDLGTIRESLQDMRMVFKSLCVWVSFVNLVLVFSIVVNSLSLLLIILFFRRRQPTSGV